MKTKALICGCGCFKFYIYWATARCASCGWYVAGVRNKDWMTKDVEVIDLIKKEADVSNDNSNSI